jgi:hypothetical protein
MDRQRQAVMEKARAKRTRRAARRRAQPAKAEGTSLADSVKSLTEGASQTLSHLASATADTIKHMVVGLSGPNTAVE